MIKLKNAVMPIALSVLMLAAFFVLLEPVQSVAGQEDAEWPYPGWNTYQVFNQEVDCMNPGVEPLAMDMNGHEFYDSEIIEDAKGEARAFLYLCTYDPDAVYEFQATLNTYASGWPTVLLHEVYEDYPTEPDPDYHWTETRYCDPFGNSDVVQFYASWGDLVNPSRGYAISAEAGANTLWSCELHNYESAAVSLTPVYAFDPVYEFCGDGIELLTDTVALSTSGSWHGFTETVYSNIYARATFKEHGDTTGLIHNVYLQLNDEEWGMTFYGDEMQTWSAGEGWTDNPYTFTIPNRTYPEEPPYDPSGHVSGTNAAITITNGYNPLDLLSVCVVPYYGPSATCPDGIEALDGALFVSGFGGSWENTVPVTSTHVVVRYQVSNVAGGVLPVTQKFMPGIDYTLFFVEADAPPGQTITFTLPTTGVVKIYDDSVYLEFYNLGIDALLESVCIVDADAIMPQLTEGECHLINPDFVDTVSTGWDTEGSVTWTDLEENGVIQANAWGTAYQAAIQTRGSVWRIEVRAKGDEMLFGTPRTGLLAGGPQIFTETLGAYYDTYGHDIFVGNGDIVQVAGNDATIDSVCLVSPLSVIPIEEGGLLDCTFPEWDPDGSGDSLLIYLFNYIGYMIAWGVCELLRGMAIAFNALIDFIREILLRIPALSDPDDGLIGWLEWLALTLTTFLDWMGINVNEIFEWFPRNGERSIAWLYDLFEQFVFWLAEQLDMDPYAILDIVRLIGAEATLFWRLIEDEAWAEFQDLLLLLQNTANVLIVLIDGVREGVSGENVAYIGQDFSGVGQYIWIGVEFINDVISQTPLSALNLVALGVITIGLTQWTIKRFMSALESVS